MGWFGSALLATFAYGLMQSAQKLSAARGLSASGLVFVSAVVATVLAAAATTLRGAWSLVDGPMVGLAAANAVFFTAGSVLLLLALQRSPAAAVLPVTKLDGLMVVAIGAIAFAERPTGLQWAGAVSGLGVVAALTWPAKRSEGGRLDSRAVALALGVACSFAASMTVGRFASRTGDKLAYVAISYAFTALLALLAARLRPSENRQTKAVLRDGTIIGVLNLVGYLLLLDAFARGPMTLIQPLFASSMLIAVAITSRLLRERLVVRHAVAMALSIGAVVLIKLGG